MQALILAGGKGSRLKPYTTVLPKPLMPVGELPIIEILMRQLAYYGVQKVILAVGYMGQLFHAFFEGTNRARVDISYSWETEPLGTAGPIKLAFDDLEDDFLLLNGDLLTTLNYRNIFEFHKSKSASATIGLYRREVKIDFGVIETDGKSKLESYNEKPVFEFDVSMGVNVLNREKIRPIIEAANYLDMPDLLMELRNQEGEVYCYREPCYWLDIGRAEDYKTAIETFDTRQSEFLPE